ncbi:AzlC family ABC transporter permease [Parasporobacterium paucivorans]|uniref:4-azaleucine resistance probable transporter AzlC n=1 Tax=Parasporobacterium paucivorans DSM 15970 TaxID=1122934 RepID=A0A1M6D5K1_9FIRM|nr:AzlC family ABC transporter permease [Parasporobacterium paucivorans]SHI68480.1 4-azaleucine resistance probable transporter AzlC [Parasporobacterium paucivorans DSM 15970]
MKHTLKTAFFKTVPVLFGYLFLGIAFGILLDDAGYNFLWSLGISIFVYAGSMQFVLISFLGGSMGMAAVALMTLSVNSRHIFYGLSFLKKFKRFRKIPFLYMIFSLTDETYSLLCSLDQKETRESDRLFFLISLLDHSYWVAGSLLGSLIGNLITFNTEGIDFAMTALFVVIFVEQWLKAKSRLPAITGGVFAILCLLIFGPDKFILPSLLASVSCLMFMKTVIEKQEALKEAS